MSSYLQSFKDFTINHPDLVTWAVVGLLVIMGVLLQRAWIKEYIAERKLKRLLRSIGVDSLHNVIIKDDIDGNIFIENLILMPDRIVIIGVKKYKGVIFAADSIDLWTQVVGNKSYKFENPLRQLETDVLTLKSKVEHSEIEERVLFVNGAEFPKGKPANVLDITEISNWRDSISQAVVPKEIQADWEKISRLVLNDEREKKIFMGDDSPVGLNLFALLSVVLVTTLWLVWRLQ